MTLKLSPKSVRPTPDESAGHFEWPAELHSDLDSVKAWKLLYAEGQANSRLSAALSFQALFLNPVRPGYRWCKGILDRVAATLLIVLFSPLLAYLFVYVAVRFGRPVYFKQIRIGFLGRPFWIYKFRSMGPNPATVPSFSFRKVSNDQRILPGVGWIRQWKLDELPQLWNVIRGEMSLVGPRPLPLGLTSLCSDEDLARFCVLPGMTGEWQAQISTTASIHEKLRLDAQYVDKISFSHDLALLLRTFLFLRRSERDHAP